MMQGDGEDIEKMDTDSNFSLSSDEIIEVIMTEKAPIAQKQPEVVIEVKKKQDPKPVQQKKEEKKVERKIEQTVKTPQQKKQFQQKNEKKSLEHIDEHEKSLKTI